ncbi:MAG: hypothetical protein AABX11_05860 [Nanoarchaeota archaeon]
MQEYDTQVCPDKLRPFVNFVKEKGLLMPELIDLFGQRNWDFPVPQLEMMAEAANHFQKVRNEHMDLSKNELNLELPIRRVEFSMNFSTEYIGDLSISSFLKLRDKIKGFRNILGSENSVYDATLYGILEENVPNGGKIIGYKIGEVSLNPMMKNVGGRRFMYIFGTQPVSFDEIKNELISINKIPQDRAWSYTLRKSKLEELNPPKAARIVYSEAQEAVKMGLFRQIGVYKLERENVFELNPDPVIIGVDHFNNNYPLFYWANGSEKRGITT